MSRPALNRLVRCVDDDRVGPQPDPGPGLGADPGAGRSAGPQHRDGRRRRCSSTTVPKVNLAPSSPGSSTIWTAPAACSNGWSACTRPRWMRPPTPDGTRRRARSAPRPRSASVVWSPFSNLWLYGVTADVPAARAAGLTVVPRDGLGAVRHAQPARRAQGRAAALRRRAVGLDRRRSRPDGDVPARRRAGPGLAPAGRPARARRAGRSRRGRPAQRRSVDEPGHRARARRSAGCRRRAAGVGRIGRS